LKTTAAAAAIALWGGVAGAATISVSNGPVSVDCSNDSCEAFSGGSITKSGGGRGGNVTGGTAGTLSSVGDLYLIGNANETNQANALDVLIDGTLGNDSFSPISRTETGDASSLTFSSLAQYVVFKVGIGRNPGDNLFVKLLGAGPVTLTFSKLSGGTGGGLSSYTEYGERPPAVPLPAAGVLLLSAFGGLALMRRRRRPA
jgi:hypothetical protein